MSNIDATDRGRLKKSAERFGREMIWKTYGLPEIVDPHRTAFSDREVLPRWGVPETIFIGTAITGAFFSRRSNANQPISGREISDSAQEVIAAGAPAVHIHVRDERGYNVLSPQRFREVIGPIRDSAPDVFIDGCLVAAFPGEWDRIDEVIADGLLEGVPVNTTAAFFGDSLFAKPPHLMIEKAAKLEEAGVLVEIAVYTDADIDNAHRYLIRPGVVSKPYVWILLPALPGCSPMHNSSQMIAGLTRMVEAIYDIDPESVIIVCAAGRASTYLASLAMLMGLHVRVGMEDTIWLWPHRDDTVESNAQHYVLASTLAASLGRRVMTPNEARHLFGRPMRRPRHGATTGRSHGTEHTAAEGEVGA